MRPVDDLAVRIHQRGRYRAELVPRAAQASHPRVQCLGRLLPALARLARLGVNGTPLCRVLIEVRARALPDVAGVRHAHVGHGGRDPLALCVVPDPFEAMRRSATIHVPALGQRPPGRSHQPDQSDKAHHADRRHGRPVAPARQLRQCIEKRRELRPTVFGFGGQTAPQHLADRLGQRLRPRRRTRLLGRDQVDEVLPDEGTIAAQRSPQRDTERILVGRRGDVPAVVLLGRHEGRRTEHCPRLGQPLGRGTVDRQRALDGRLRRAGDAAFEASKTKVGHLDHVAGEQHVGGLEVAVDEPDRMGSRESTPGGDVAAQHLRTGLRPGLFPLLQRRAVHELHDQKYVGPRPLDVEDLDDVGVRQLGHRSGLGDQARAGVHGLHPADLLDRDVPRQLAIERPEYAAHPTAPELLANVVAIRQPPPSYAGSPPIAPDLRPTHLSPTCHHRFAP